MHNLHGKRIFCVTKCDYQRTENRNCVPSE